MVCPPKLTLRKRHFFAIEKYIEDAKQKEKDVPDLLASIMRPTCLVKEELRPNLFKLSQFRPKITKIRACTFQMSGKIPDSSWTSPRAPLFAICGRASGQIFKKMKVLARQGPCSCLGAWLAAGGPCRTGIEKECRGPAPTPGPVPGPRASTAVPFQRRSWRVCVLKKTYRKTYFFDICLIFFGSGVWICQLGAWNCQLGVWICLLGAWNCLFGAWICLLGVWICHAGSRLSAGAAPTPGPVPGPRASTAVRFQCWSWRLRKPGHFHFLQFLVPDWASGPVQMCRDRRDIAGRALEVGFGRDFVEKVGFSSKFKARRATHPFFGLWIHEYLFTNASTRFVMCFSFRTRSSNLISVSQSLPNHEFFKNG